MNFHSRSLIATLMVLLTIILGFFVVKPRWVNYKETRTTVASAQAEADSLKQAQDQVNRYLEEFNQHSADAKLLNTALPLNQAQIENVLSNLSAIAAQNGIALGTLDTDSIPDSLGTQSFSITPVILKLTIKGTFASFRSFMQSLERSLRVMDVTTINVQTSDTGELTFNLEFRTYYQK